MTQSTPPGPGEGMMFASELISARQEKGLTQSQLSEKSGLSISAIKAYESGRNMPGARELRALCKALEVTPNKLLFGTELPFSTRSLLDLITDANAEEDSVQRARMASLLHLLTSDERRAIFVLLKSLVIARHGEATVTDQVRVSDLFIASMVGMAEDAKVKERTGKNMTPTEQERWIEEFMTRHGHILNP